MATPANPPPTDPSPSAEWPNLSQVVAPGAKSQLDPSLPPLVGVKRPNDATPLPDPPPVARKDTRAPVWTEESICVPQPPPPAATETAAAAVPPSAPKPERLSASHNAYLSPNFRGQIGHYEVKDLIGEGGMGLVFRAEDIYLRRKVALKVMKPHVSNDEVAWKLFLTEAQATAQLQSPRIATVYEVNEKAGTMYLAMELLKGESLEARLERGSLSLAESLVVIREAALGLAVAHAEGLYHRDVKPANLWLTGPVGGNKSSDILRQIRQDVAAEIGDSRVLGVKLLDFGLVRWERDSNGQMRRGSVVGTPAYMAPEQAMGEMGDARSDLFSLGVVMYRLLTGKLPFEGDTALELMTALASHTPPPLTDFNPKIPPLLVDLQARLLSRDPQGRPNNANHVADAIQCVLEEMAEPPPKTPVRDPGRSNRRKALLVGCGMFLTLAAAFAYFAFRGKSGPRDNLVTAPAGAAAGALAPHQVTARVGERVTVEFTVEKIERSTNGLTYIYANDAQLKNEQFRLVLPNSLMRAMSDHGFLRAETAVGQVIRATGMITREGAVAELLIQEPTQFDRLPPRAPGSDKSQASAAKSKGPARPATKGKSSSGDNTVVVPEDDFGQPLPNGLIPRPGQPNNYDDEEDLAKALEDLAKLLKNLPGAPPNMPGIPIPRKR